MRDQEPAFRDKGAPLAAISLGDAHYGQVFREETGITFPLLVDTERRAYRAVGLLRGSIFHIFRRDNSLARKRARATGHQQHKLGKNPFQLGGSFVFGPGNVDLYMHVSQTFGDNAPTADLLAAIP